MTKATNKHSEYVVLVSLPLQQWLHERVSMSTFARALPVLSIIIPRQKWLPLLLRTSKVPGRTHSWAVLKSFRGFLRS